MYTDNLQKQTFTLTIFLALQVASLHWPIIALILQLILMDRVRTLTVHGHLTECWVKCEGVAQGEIWSKNVGDFQIFRIQLLLIYLVIYVYRCMASSLVRTGFVRGSTTQGNGCYQHRCTNNSLEVWFKGS